MEHEASIHWLPHEGGRVRPVVGPTVLACTAYRRSHGIEDLFSVILKVSGDDGAGRSDLQFVTIAPLVEKFDARLRPDEELVVTEGRKPIAICRIVTASDPISP